MEGFADASLQIAHPVGRSMEYAHNSPTIVSQSLRARNFAGVVAVLIP